MKSVYPPSEGPGQNGLSRLRYPAYTNGIAIGWLIFLAMHISGIYLILQFNSPHALELLKFGLSLWFASFFAGPLIAKHINIGAQNQRIEDNFNLFEELGFAWEAIDYSDTRAAQHFFGMAIDTERCLVTIIENSQQYTYHFKDIDIVSTDHRTSSYTTKVKTGSSSGTTYSSKGIHFSDINHYKDVTKYTDSHYRLVLNLKNNQMAIFHLTFGGVHKGSSANRIAEKLRRSVYDYQSKNNIK